MSNFGEKLRIAREALGLTQEKLGLMLGTSKQVVSTYETGTRTPKINYASQYAKALNIPLDFLLNDNIAFQLWEHESMIEDYWRASASERLHLVTLRGIDPRIAFDYKNISSIKEFVYKLDNQLTPDEKELLFIFKQVTPEGQKYIMLQAKFAEDHYSISPSRDTKTG